MTPKTGRDTPHLPKELEQLSSDFPRRDALGLCGDRLSQLRYGVLRSNLRSCPEVYDCGERRVSRLNSMQTVFVHVTAEYGTNARQLER